MTATRRSAIKLAAGSALALAAGAKAAARAGPTAAAEEDLDHLVTRRAFLAKPARL